jgi:hypothetical protein
MALERSHKLWRRPFHKSSIDNHVTKAERIAE